MAATDIVFHLTFGWREVEADGQDCAICIEKIFLGPVLQGEATVKETEERHPIDIFVCNSCKDQLECP